MKMEQDPLAFILLLMGIFQILNTRGPGGGSWNVLITGPPSWGFDVPLARALCTNLPAENTQQ